MTGGAGADVFAFNQAQEGDFDRILDFEDGVDSLILTGVQNAPGSGLQGRLDALEVADALVEGESAVELSYEGQIILVTGLTSETLGLEDVQFL